MVVDGEGGGGGAAAAGMSGGSAERLYATAKTSVWWDIENCQVPRSCYPHLIAQNISSALAAMKYSGPVSISAYGDTRTINASVQHALSSTGIALNHVPAGVKDASDKKILVDMLFWAVDNPPPATYLLISGDCDFSNALHQLRMRRYNILLAQPGNVSQALVAAAKCVWLWTDLVAGQLPLSLQYSINDNEISSESNRIRTVEARNLTDPWPSEPSFTYPDVHANGRSTNILETTSNELLQSQSGTQAHASTTEINQKSAAAMSNTDAQTSAHVNFYGNNPFISQSSPMKSLPRSNGSHKPEVKQFSVPHEFFGRKPGIFAEPAPTAVTFSVPPNNDVCLPTNFHGHQYPHFFFPLDAVPSGPYQHAGSLPYSNSIRTLYRPNGTNPSPSVNAPVILSAQQSRPYATTCAETRHNGPPFSAGPPFVPHISRLNIAKSPNSHNKSVLDHSSFHKTPGTYPTVKILMDNVLYALSILKKEKISPTEANIADCIHYGEINIPDFDVRKALEYAVKHHVVVMHKLGSNLFFVGKGGSLWKCVNVLDTQIRHPKPVWDAILKFLTSADGHASIMASRCMYEAATILNWSCLKNFGLGKTLQILNTAIYGKKWILPSSSGWQPLSLLLPADMNAEYPLGSSIQHE